MIQAFHKFSQSRLAKVFLAILALSFILFFGGGSWFRSNHYANVVAEVGGSPITVNELRTRIQHHVQAYGGETGKNLTPEEIEESGLPEFILGQLIQEKLLNLETKHLGLTVTDEALRDHIHAIKAFQNERGVFDRTRFTQILHSHGLSEEAFLAEVRQESLQNQLISSITVGALLPQDMVDHLFDATYQYRQASLLMMSPKDMPTPPPPSESVLEAFYKEHQKEFKTPELRNLTVFVIYPDVIAKEIPVSDEQIKATYEEKYEALGKPLEDIRGVVVSAIQKEKAAEEMYKITQHLEDEVAGGATFEELVKTVPGAELVKLEEVNGKGEKRTGALASSLPQDKELSQEILHTGFDLEEEKDSQFAQVPSGAYYSVRVDKIIPSSFEPFADIKKRVLKDWIEREQRKEAQAKAEKYVNSFNQGDKKISLMTLLPNLSLSEPSPKVSDEIKGLVFSLRPGYAGMTAVPEGYAVVVLKAIIPPSQKVKNEKMASFKEEVLNQYKNDLLLAYVNALRVRFPVKINREIPKTLNRAQQGD